MGDRSKLMPDPLDLVLQIQPYVDSANETSAGAVWPLVRRVRLTGPWSHHIGSSVLVDAPGVQDDNSARDRLVRDTGGKEMSNATHD